jgi:hypothetical protein
MQYAQQNAIFRKPLDFEDFVTRVCEAFLEPPRQEIAA